MDDEPGFDDFVAEQTDALLRYGYVLTGNPHDAADLVQERWCGCAVPGRG
ncbi:RNA polymerase ECF sigma factor [[Actinomadura] parvosata subsp. kistnae]|nr:RNA polymerase ECF sigma factor [Actinomadura parvosata subsp. kistnae]